MNEANSRSSNAPSGEQGKSFSSANFNDTSSISSGSSAHSDRDQSKKLSSGSSAGGHGTKNSSSNNPKRKLISALLSTTSSSNNNSNSSLCDQSFSYSSSSRTDTLSSMQRKKLRVSYFSLLSQFIIVQISVSAGMASEETRVSQAFNQFITTKSMGSANHISLFETRLFM